MFNRTANQHGNKKPKCNGSMYLNQSGLFILICATKSIFYNLEKFWRKGSAVIYNLSPTTKRYSKICSCHFSIPRNVSKAAAVYAHLSFNKIHMLQIFNPRKTSSSVMTPSFNGMVIRSREVHSRNTRPSILSNLSLKIALVRALHFEVE